jgi:thiamine-phosphate pyrophosphorylase
MSTIIPDSRARATPPIGRLHLVTDTTLQSRYSHAELAELAIAGGVDTVQYRSKSTDFRALLSEAGEVAEVCRGAGVLFLVNDRVDLCIAVGADGVHLGRSDMPVSIARTILGPNRIIGGTVRNRPELLAAVEDGADYVGLGPVFATRSKSVDHPPLGVDLVARVANDASVPVIAIAGISETNILEVLHAGVFGVAVIGAVAAAEDVSAAAAALAEIMRKAREWWS